MPLDHQPSSDRNTTNRIRTIGQAIGQAYRTADGATHHVLGWCLKALLLFYFVFCTLLLVVRYVVMPQIENYRVDIEQVASRTLGLPVAIGAITASWDGLRPHLSLTDVTIRDRDGRLALRLPGVAATVAWESVVLATIRLESLQIDRPQLDIRRDAKGELFIAGLPLDVTSDSDGKVLDWILSQHNISIVDGQLTWRDDLRQAPALSLENVDVRLHNSGHTHQFGLTAVPPAQLAAPLDIRAKFTHPYFGASISDVTRWSGVLYTNLRNTDLARWKPYLDFPFDLRQAKGSVRAWLNFDRARVADFTADLSLTAVDAQLREDLQALELTRVDGRISVRETLSTQEGDGVPTFGANGHAIALENFSMQTRDGLVLPTTTLSERFVAATKNKPERTEVSARQLDLQAISSFVGRLPLSPDHLQMLHDFSPRGQLRNFSAQWEGRYPDISSYQVEGQFNQLALHAQLAKVARPAASGLPAQAAVPAIPGFENLSGSINANNKGGVLVLGARQVKFLLPGYFVDPELDFDVMNVDAKWVFQKNDQLLVDVRKLNFAKQQMQGAFAGTHLMPLDRTRNSSLGVVDMRGTITGLPLAEVGDYLPIQMDADAREWLSNALVGGTLRDGQIKIKGDLARFPFATVAANATLNKSTDKSNSATAEANLVARANNKKEAKKDKENKNKPQGEFLFTGRIEDGSLNYDPGFFGRDGKKPLWPLLEKIQGTIKFDRARMEIDADSAMTHGAEISKVKAVIPDLRADNLMLNIDGRASGALQNFIDYTIDSPVSDWIARFTDDTRASGDATLALKLALPLDHLTDAKVDGVVKFDNNNVTLMPALPLLSQASGQLEFNEKGLNLKDVKATFLGGAMMLSGGTQKNNDIVIKAAGTMSAAGIGKNFAAPNLKNITSRISGSTRYAATIAVRNKQLDILAESNLRGLGLNFPAPLSKTANADLPLKLTLNDLASEQKDVLRDVLKLSLGNVIAATYQREKNATQAQAEWRVVRGGIGVNVAAPVPDSGLAANVDLPELNVDDWLKIVSSISAGSVTSGNVKPAEKTSDAGTGASDVSQYIEPNMIAARTDKLILLGKQLDHVVVGASHDINMWQANIDATQVSGYVAWRESSSGRGLGKVTARLASLIVPDDAKEDVKGLLQQDDADTVMPALDIVAENFELFGKKLGQLELVAHYVRATSGREWSIQKLALRNPDAVLSATGKWLASGKRSTSSLAYKLEIADAGQLLNRFGYEDVLRHGKGSMSGDVTWQGAPFSLDIPSLTGAIRLDVSAGQFLKVDPGAAKLLGVLSLQSIPRRLTLDFRDVFSQGFAFDDIKGTATIKEGVAATDNFKMRGVSATVLMDGTADIAKETQNLHVVVIPEINAGAASVAYALAINPVIGVGTFLAQLFLREPLARAFTFEYKVTGPWADPVVTKIDRKVNQGSNADDKQELKPDDKLEQKKEATAPSVPAGKASATNAPVITPSISNDRKKAE